MIGSRDRCSASERHERAIEVDEGNFVRAETDGMFAELLAGPAAQERIDSQAKRYGRVIKATGMKIE